MAYAQDHHHYHLLRMREMGRVYWCQSIGGMAIQLVAIFVPIFLLKSGYSFRAVLFYLALQQLFAVLMQYPAAELFRFINPHRLLAVGNIFYIILFALLTSLHQHHWPLVFLALVWGLNHTIYWSAFHYTFSLARAHKNSIHQIASINSLVTLGSTAAPAIGGIVATIFGITYVYIAAIVFLLVASAPMLTNAGPARTVVDFSFTEFWRMRRDALANFLYGTTGMAEQYVWPLFIYLIVRSYAGIGALSSLIALSSIFVTMYVAKREPSTGEGRYIKGGIATYSLTSLGRAIVQTTPQVFGINLLGGIGRSLFITPYLHRYYHNSDGPYRLGYITVMESSYSLGATLYLFGLIALTLFFSASTVLTIGLFFVAFTIAGLRLIR